MSEEKQVVEDTQEEDKNNESKIDVTGQYITMKLGDQVFGVPVSNVRDVIMPQGIARIPLAPTEIIGSLNLRGRIVTAMNMKAMLNIEGEYNFEKSMSIVVENNEELYSLVVDYVGEVINLTEVEIVKNPENMSKNWQEVSIGIYPIEERLIVILDVGKLLNKLHN